ncbi:NUDIX domain-containing protein [Ruminococcus flavefaciens]|uniref:NUDIX hydrolase n=1 Tax=Ruminococcus flavefaciens TaxID=1265 RepID=UPI0026E9765F|nr:NUDIX domain-containing protein [Ruminococcus flavefaciens]
MGKREIMEKIMEDVEIFLSRLAPEDKLYAETAKKLGSADITDRFTLAGAVAEKGAPASYKVYISDEDIQNDTIDDIKAVFAEAAEENDDIRVEFISDEFLNLIDDKARITAESKPRTLVHRDGDLHPTVHIWMIKRRDGGIFVLLQKRAHEKDINPDCYDVSAAGHVSQGEEFRHTALKEVREELGLDMDRSKLEFIGLKRAEYTKGDIHDNELVAVYICREKINIEDLVLQSSEVSEVCWAEIDELLCVMKYEDIPNCISLEELDMIKKAVF